MNEFKTLAIKNEREKSFTLKKNFYVCAEMSIFS